MFAGCGAIMVDAKTDALGHVGVAISFGLVIMVMIYALGHISGAHFNPAVTFAFALARHFPWPRVGVYWAAQLAGALAAASSFAGHWATSPTSGATLPSGSDGQAFLWEGVLTFFLMLVIVAVATDTRAVGEAAAIAIGGAVGLDAMFGGPDHRRFDESGALARARDRVRRVHRDLGVHDGAAARCGRRRGRVPFLRAEDQPRAVDEPEAVRPAA